MNSYFPILIRTVSDNKLRLIESSEEVPEDDTFIVIRTSVTYLSEEEEDELKDDLEMIAWVLTAYEGYETAVVLGVFDNFKDAVKAFLDAQPGEEDFDCWYLESFNVNKIGRRKRIWRHNDMEREGVKRNIAYHSYDREKHEYLEVNFETFEW